MPVGLWPNAPGDVPQYTYDLDKAKQLLADGRGTRKGLQAEPHVRCGEPPRAALRPLIKESFAKIGVNVNVQQLLWNQQWAKAKGAAAKRQDLFVLLWWPSYPDGYDNLNSMFRPETTPAWNLAYWYSTDYDTP